MTGGWRIEGHAIVSSDDRIADASGHVPPELRNEADWARFQRALDAAAVTVLGRLGHEANPNPRRRNRLVVSSSAGGLERRADAWWWDPAKASLTEALALAAPGGGPVAVVGGRRVFDLFLDLGFDRFDLVRMAGVRLPGGIPLFSGVDRETNADDILSRHDFSPGLPEVLDERAGVNLVSWRPASASALPPS